VARDQANGIDVHGPDYVSSRVVVRADRQPPPPPSVNVTHDGFEEGQGSSA
jgi:hypothetical protein